MTGSATFSGRTAVKGSVHLILGEGTTLTAAQSITVSPGNSLTISGGGALNAVGIEGFAAIGGAVGESCGTVTIDGGTVSVTGSVWGAGIGAGRAPNDAASGDSGSITITGGTVVAIGGENAQAIGVSNEVADHDSGTLAFGDVNVRADQNQDSFADYASREKMCRGAQVYIEPCGHSYDTDPALILQWCHWCGAVGPVGGKGGFVLPASVKSIAPGAFAGLSMRTVYIPDGCTAIGAGAFADCRNLKQIRIPDTVKPEDVQENVFPAGAALFLIGPAEGTASQLANDPAHPEWKFVEE